MTHDGPSSSSAPASLPRRVARLALAWLPFFVTWVLFLRVFAREPLAGAFFSGLGAVTNAAILGLGVWWLTGRLTWPDRIRPGFYVAHLLAGAIYAAAWTGTAHLLALAFVDQGTMWVLQASNLIGWRFLIGLYLYGLVAGVSYAVRMRGRLAYQEALAARAQTLAAEARLQSLRSQVNPHFLFNALHTVGALTRVDPAAARDAIDKLGELLHYALNDDGRERVTLAEEWQFAERYLELERLRLGDRLQVRQQFADGADRCLVPPFLIQGLVENAVRHGVARSVSGGTVAVYADLDRDRLRIVVRDDGAGPDPQDGTNGGGRGLRLLRERLAALYDGLASVQAGPGPDQGFEVTVTLPALSGSAIRVPVRR
jgi:hypothetical protein